MSSRPSGTSRVEFRMPVELKTEVEEAANLTGVSFTSFATEALIQQARRIKREHTQTVLQDRERDAFIALVSNPPKPSEKLVKLMNAKVEL